MNGKTSIWVAWEYQTRNRSLSALLNIPLYEIVSEKKGLRRYVESLSKTLRLIRSRKPDVIFCQNPSIVLSFFCVFLKRLLSCSVIVDEHNAGLFPLDGKSKVMNSIARYIVRSACAVIVTNTSLASQCQIWGGSPIVVEDPLPDFGTRYSVDEQFCTKSKAKNKRPFELMFICTWASDEPYMEVLQAANAFSGEALRIIITGRYSGKVDPSEIPACVHLTGFLSKKDYVNQLASVDGVIVLTTRRDCLNCGAYEAVSLLKPGILSDTTALRSYFSSGFLFTDNSVGDIIHCVQSLISRHDGLRRNIEALKLKCEANDLANRQKVINLLADFT